MFPSDLRGEHRDVTLTQCEHTGSICYWNHSTMTSTNYPFLPLSLFWNMGLHGPPTPQREAKWQTPAPLALTSTTWALEHAAHYLGFYLLVPRGDFGNEKTDWCSEPWHILWSQQAAFHNPGCCRLLVALHKPTAKPYCWRQHPHNSSLDKEKSSWCLQIPFSLHDSVSVLFYCAFWYRKVPCMLPKEKHKYHPSYKLFDIQWSTGLQEMPVLWWHKACGSKQIISDFT